MEKMTPTERVAYAHGRINRDMQDFQRQIDRMHADILHERNLWLIMVAIATVLIGVVFLLAGPNELRDFIVIGVVLATFTLVRFISYRTIRHQIKMVEQMRYLYSRLADDETIGFVTESMKIEGIEEIRHAGLPEQDALCKQLMTALKVISAMMDEIEREREAESKTDPTQDIHDTDRAG